MVPDAPRYLPLRLACPCVGFIASTVGLTHRHRAARACSRAPRAPAGWGSSAPRLPPQLSQALPPPRLPVLSLSLPLSRLAWPPLRLRARARLRRGLCIGGQEGRSTDHDLAWGTPSPRQPSLHAPRSSAPSTHVGRLPPLPALVPT
jgi:hypothetical protein